MASGSRSQFLYISDNSSEQPAPLKSWFVSVMRRSLTRFHISLTTKQHPFTLYEYQWVKSSIKSVVFNEDPRLNTFNIHSIPCQAIGTITQTTGRHRGLICIHHLATPPISTEQLNPPAGDQASPSQPQSGISCLAQPAGHCPGSFHLPRQPVDLHRGRQQPGVANS